MTKHISMSRPALLGLGLVGLAALALPARAATITVDTTADAIDTSGDCSLREAVLAANTDAAVDGCSAGEAAGDTIMLPAGTWTLSITGADETWESGTGGQPYQAVELPDATVGDLDLTGSVAIVGAGSDATLIRWVGADADRVFQVAAPAEATIEVALEGLSLQGGSVEAVVVNDTDPVESQWIFRRFGGGVAMGAGAGLKLTGSSGPSDDGGPSEDEASAFGTASLALSDVHILGCYAGGDAGGLFSAGPLSMDHVWFEANTTEGNGGAWYQEGDFSAQDLVMADNVAEGGGGMFASGPTTGTITRALIQGNYATGGGGVSIRSLVVMTVRDAVVTGNEAFDVGGGFYSNGTMDILGSSFVANLAGGDAAFGGGALNTFGGGTFTVGNTLFSGNVAGAVSSACGCTGGSCTVGDSYVSLGHNIESGESCGFNGPADREGTDPMLRPLADYGGYFEVYALQADSPAVDGGDETLASSTDARGLARPQDGDSDGVVSSDVGAFELSPQEIDLDGDGYCPGQDIGGTLYCSDGSLPGDCDETLALRFPGNPEVCDGLDNDCNLLADDGLPFADWWRDADTDGYGDLAQLVTTCDGAPTGYVGDATDCDDTQATVFPGNPEVCDGLDNDCNLSADDGLTFQDWWLDADVDGYGDPAQLASTCDGAPTGYIDDATDCNDASADVHPGATEVCNTDVDDDCNGLADDLDPAVDLSTGGTWYVDADQDGYGDPAAPVQACAQPVDTVVDSTDCDDATATINPGQPEIFDNDIDDDCDGAIDKQDSDFTGCGSGCSSTGSPSPVAWLGGLLALLGLTIRRRR